MWPAHLCADSNKYMSHTRERVRILYSFPHKLGAGRICYTAWQQVNGLAAAGADILVFPGALQRPVPDGVRAQPTLARGKLRIPYRLLGTMRALALHDYVVSRRVEKLAGQIDVIHTWPDAALQTLKVARRLGIPTVLERPNAHTRYAYEAVEREAKRLGVVLPPDNEYAFKTDVLEREEEEYRLADYLLCPSDFVLQTFLDEGFKRQKLIRHQYGFDERSFHPDTSAKRDPQSGLTMLFVGDCAVRKGLHFALEAWLDSGAQKRGTFLIAGKFLPAYAERLAPMLSHSSVRVLGFRNDVPDLMRKSDILVLPSIEEGFPLVCMDGMGSGCVPLVSEVCSGICRHMENALVHRIGDVKTLTGHIRMLDENRGLLQKLRESCLRSSQQLTWTSAGERLLEIYRQVAANDTAELKVMEPC
jgi:glycosyltransferase involved in cell wall biosynthesis